MKLQTVSKARHCVATWVDGDCSHALEFLRTAPADMQASAKGMTNLFDRYAQAGRQQLPSAVFHEASKKDCIWQFIKGRLRVFCFIDSDGTLLVLTRGNQKDTKSRSRRSSTRGADTRHILAGQSKRRCGVGEH